MPKKYREIRVKVFHYRAYKWIVAVLALFILICLSLKCCNQFSDSNSIVNDSNQKTDNDIQEKPRDSNPFMISLPPKQNIRISPIDSSDIKQVEDDPLGRYAVNELLNVYLHNETDLNDFLRKIAENFPNDTIIANYYAEVYKRIQLKVDENRKEAIRKALKLDTTNVKFVTDEWLLKSYESLGDPGFSKHQNSWFYKNIGLFDVWKITKGNPDVKIAILDDGFDLTHEEIKNRYIDEWNVFDYSKTIYSDLNTQFHGTHVASTVIGEQNNNFGISGVSPNCMFIPIQISNRSGIITTSSLLDGIFYALKNDADVINLSLGFSLGDIAGQLTNEDQTLIEKNDFLEEQQLWDEVFEIAAKDGVIVVQAAGNDNIIAGVDPMKRSNSCIIVGAINEAGFKAEFSNHGNKVNVYAPGTKIYSALPNNKMGYLDGTSMAAPIVAGCVALYISHNKEYTPKQIVKLFSKHNNEKKLFNINDLINLSI